MTRKTEVTIINRKANGAFTTTIEFDTADDFMVKCDEAIDSTEFYKVDLDIDTDVFTATEIETLKEEGFLF